MFAVIKTGGKQYRVAAEDVIIVERLKAEAGDTFVFDDVLMLGDGTSVEFGEPALASAQVVGEVVEQRRAAKVIIFKKRQRNTYRRKKGHRQLETVVKITEILAKGGRDAGVKASARPAARPAPGAEASGAPEAAKPARPKPAKAAPASDGAIDARGRLAGPVGGEADDLKAITGVGKVLEKKLNEAGVFHFWQIAALTPEQIEALEADMNFPGRIARDGWMEQAAALAKGEKPE